jgi:methyltransferase (TIGR00027 family)
MSPAGWAAAQILFSRRKAMTENQAGITALITAYSRAYHAVHDTPLIFNDFLADQLFTAEEHFSFDRDLAGLLAMIDPELAAAYPDPAEALAQVMQLQNAPVTLSRSRYTEDSLEQAVEQGVEQYVILGAGFDTFAFRRPDMLRRLAVFEVDHPVTQEMKRQRMAARGWEVPAQLHFVPVDFRSESLSQVLPGSGYDPLKRTFFSWLGVTYYLDHPVIIATLEAIARLAPAGSQVAFDYIDSDGFLPGRAGPRMTFMQTIARMVGEPMKTGFHPSVLGSELERAGFRLHESLSPDEIEKRYFQSRSDAYHAFEYVHFALSEVV